MQGELEAEYPLLAQLQELAAQTRRQIADRGESLQTSSTFSSSAQDDCQKASRRANAQAAARVGAANSIEAALQVLETATGVARKVQKQNAALSFVQFSSNSQITAADVFSLFPSTRPRRRINTGFAEIQEMDASPAAFQQRQRVVQPSDDAKPQIKALLTELKGESSSDQEHTQWCMNERARNEMQLRLKQDAVDQIDAEISAHADAQGQLDEDLAQIDSRVAFLEKAAKDVKALGQKEKAFAKNTGKDHSLATRILDQAVASCQTSRHGLQPRASQPSRLRVQVMQPPL